MTRLLLAAIALYQRTLSVWLGPRCRFHPSCSSYTATCIERFGAAQGSWLGARRIARCHPFHPGGFDPPPLPLHSRDEVGGVANSRDEVGGVANSRDEVGGVHPEPTP